MGEKKSINLRFEEDELALVRDRAKRLGMSVQQYLHTAAMNEVNAVQRAFVASARDTVASYAEAFPAPEEDRAARRPARDRESQAAREDTGGAARDGGRAA
ncbi:hypothetical protein GCM10027168_69780 [Streptomyces capparidis]